MFLSNIDYTNIPTGLVIFVKLLLQNTVKSSHLLINFLKPAFLQIRGKHDDYRNPLQVDNFLVFSTNQWLDNPHGHSWLDLIY